MKWARWFLAAAFGLGLTTASGLAAQEASITLSGDPGALVVQTITAAP